jgi:hypothetical protein
MMVWASESVAADQIVKNNKGGLWKGSPAVKLEFLRRFGGDAPEDENSALKSPCDVVCDSLGNIYVLDSGNNRIQKFNAEGKFLISIGRRGQGPREFQYASSLAIDSRDRIFVYDGGNLRIQILLTSGEMEEIIKLTNVAQSQIRLLKSGDIVIGAIPSRRALLSNEKSLPKLINIIDSKGMRKSSFGDMRDYQDILVNSMANRPFIDIDRENNIVMAFLFQNRVEKLTSTGALIWRSERELDYGTEVIDKGFIEQDEKGTSVQAPKMNSVSLGIASDRLGRYWVLTMNHQGADEKTRSKDISEISKNDLYKLEVFRSDGVLLGDIPLDHHAHGIRIYADSLFIWEQIDAIVYQYKIIDSI